MTSYLISVSIVLAMTLITVYAYSNYLDDIVAYEVKCKIQNIDVFEITNTSYLLELEILNNGDYPIMGYNMTLSNSNQYTKGIILVGDYVEVDFITNSIEDEFIVVFVDTAKGTGSCITEVEL